ncbi:MAG TPA: response regulator transcription factor [Acidimicrobiia bacterium]|nr:response regulator transcription factor [Acidimicrobiia bacterium]
MIRCVLGDRSVFFTEGVTSILRESGQAVVVGRTASPDEVPALVGRLDPDVVIVGFEPSSASVAVARRVARAPVLLLTWSRREDDLIDALRAGATGFLHKEVDPDELLRAITDVAAGRTAFPPGWERLLVSRLDGHRPAGLRRNDPIELTQRERDIVQLIVDGHSNKALAAALGIAHQTAKNHVRHVMAKVRVSSRTQLCAWAIERGYVPTQAAATA